MEALPREALKLQLKPERLDTEEPYINTPQNQYKVHTIKIYAIALISDTLLKLPYANFIIGDFLAGTTPVTI